MLIHGKVANGKIELEELEEANKRPDGAEVTVLVHDEGFELSAEDEAELEDRIVEIERGEWIGGDEFLAQLRQRRRSA